jgi:predicted AlkP superfamily pyrophosphatase or phosphodiesterase
MTWRSAALRVSVLLGLVGLVSLALGHVKAPPAPERPRLAVMIVFDQLRGDYLERWQSLFGDGGFRRLQNEGAWFTNCHYPYAHTVTAAGHASLATGCLPPQHGIADNEWYDSARGSEVNSVATDRYKPVPELESSGVRRRLGRGAAPTNLRAPTLADTLKQATGGRAKVVSLSYKDRAAVLPGGQHPDACYWIDETGIAITSEYYRSKPHSWVEAFNRSRPTERWLGTEWTRLRSDIDYVRYSGPDDVEGESGGAPFVPLTRTFPHALGGGPSKSRALYQNMLYLSPFGNEVLLDLTKRAIDGEQLGSGDTPGLLCVSFSSTDSVGHAWGPDSQEVLDITLRADRIVKELLDYLDARVGKGRYVVAMSADHGVCPLPEVSRQRGKEAMRIMQPVLRAEAEAFLHGKFAGSERDRWLADFSGAWFTLNRALLQQPGRPTPEKAAEALAKWLPTRPGIAAAYTRTQLSQRVPPDDEMAVRVQRSFVPDRCGDVVVVPKPYCLITRVMTGTLHGTPYPYDTHVPLLVYGPGVRSGIRREAVTPLAMAVILANALGVPPPAKAEVGVPASLR